MHKKATLRDVATLAGVHPATASRALNATTRRLVRASTVLRVTEAAQALDYQADHLARCLKTRRSASVGVLVPDITNPLFPPILRGIEDRLGERGYVSLVANTDNDPARERLVLSDLRARRVDGLIVATACRSHPLLVETAESGLAMVLANRVVDEEALASVSVDDRAGTTAAVAHLAGLGHRRVAHLAGPQHLSTGFGRLQGFLAATEALGLDSGDELVAVARSFSEAEGYRCAKALLGAGPTATGIVAGNDMLALGALRAIGERGLRCPASISLVGFNDMPLVDRITPSLTTVRVPHYEIGATAADLLLEQLERDEADEGRETAERKASTILLPFELVVRASSAAPPG